MVDEKPGDSQFVVEPPVRQNTVARPTAVVTLTLIAINVLVLLAMAVKGISPISPNGASLIPWGANFGPLTMNGQWWRLLTACFLHFGIIHLAFNMYVLYQVGITTEFLYGKAKYLLVYILSGVIGNVVSVYIHPFSVGAGASGAVFGVYGAFLGFLFIRRSVIPKQAMTQMAKSAGIFLGINLIYGLSDGSTDLSAHIGGLMTGLLLGTFLLRLTSSGAGRSR
jgi:rhomboid protease GluP